MIMRNFILFSYFLILSSFIASAQSNGVIVPGKWSDQIFISDVNGRPFENKYGDYAGSIFNNDAYTLSDVTLSDGRKFHHVQSKIDFLGSQMIFMSSEGKVGILGSGAVKEIAFYTSVGTSSPNLIYRSGFPKVDLLTPNNFYQVLADGKCMLLKSTSKFLTENKNELSGEVSRVIETVENIYVFFDGKMTRLKKDREAVLDILIEKRKELIKYKEENNLDLKNNDELVKLVMQYNILQ